jgi:hypothetical protein
MQGHLRIPLLLKTAEAVLYLRRFIVIFTLMNQGVNPNET